MFLNYSEMEGTEHSSKTSVSNACSCSLDEETMKDRGRLLGRRWIYTGERDLGCWRGKGEVVGGGVGR